MFYKNMVDLFYKIGTCWFSVKPQPQNWMGGPGRLGVGQPKAFVHKSLGENSATPNEKGEVDMGDSLVLPQCSKATPIWSERLAKDPARRCQEGCSASRCQEGCRSPV